MTAAMLTLAIVALILVAICGSEMLFDRYRPAAGAGLRMIVAFGLAWSIVIVGAWLAR